MDFLIPAWLIVVVYVLATIVKFDLKQYEHAITRLFLAAAYLYIGMGIQIESARELSRWFVLLLGFIEVTSRLFRKWKANGHN